MRTTIIGGKEIQLRANPLALFFYRQTFNQDMMVAVMELQSKMQRVGEGDYFSLDMVGIFQLAYAMHKASWKMPIMSIPEKSPWPTSCILLCSSITAATMSWPKAWR